MAAKKSKTVYRVAKGLLSALMLFSAGMYFLNYEMIVAGFTKLGHPTYLIYPLAIAKILGVIAIWANQSELLKQWAYAGFFFVSALALTAHLQVGDGEWQPALIGVVLSIATAVLERK
jgi:hypothetical protein